MKAYYPLEMPEDCGQCPVDCGKATNTNVLMHTRPADCPLVERPNMTTKAYRDWILKHDEPGNSEEWNKAVRFIASKLEVEELKGRPSRDRARAVLARYVNDGLALDGWTNTMTNEALDKLGFKEVGE